MSKIVIVGGQLHNKGAQAMVYTVADQMKIKYPDKEVILFASVFKDKDKEIQKNLKIKIFPWTIRTKMKILNDYHNFLVGPTRYLKYFVKGTNISKEKVSQLKDILNDTDLMIDVSGYALSSQRGVEASISYLYNIIIAKKFNIEMILMPQSFGPFDYEKGYKKILTKKIKEFLKYPKKIYAREHEGFNFLNEFDLNNVEKSLDLVLQGDKEYNLNNLFKETTLKKKNTIIKESSVAIIPNEKIMKHGDPNTQYFLYKAIIEKLIENNKNVYLIYHSNEDFEICKKLKSFYTNCESVILIELELDCIDIDYIIGDFEFIVGSRYHSIVHGYKSETPAFVFGWAIKYKELMEYFSQDQYLFDVRAKNYNENEVIIKLEKMIAEHSNESLKIKSKMKKISKNNLFDHDSIFEKKVEKI